MPKLQDTVGCTILKDIENPTLAGLGESNTGACIGLPYSDLATNDKFTCSNVGLITYNGDRAIDVKVTTGGNTETHKNVRHGDVINTPTKKQLWVSGEAIIDGDSNAT